MYVLAFISLATVHPLPLLFCYDYSRLTGNAKKNQKFAIESSGSGPSEPTSEPASGSTLDPNMDQNLDPNMDPTLVFDFTQVGWY